MFTQEDKNQIAERGISLEQVTSQLKRFEKGFSPLSISAPATVGNGILKLEPSEIASLIGRYDSTDQKVTKFVPASGAASRMFKSLFAFVENFDGSEESLSTIKKEDKQIASFFDNPEGFAFYQKWDDQVKETKGKSIKELLEEFRHGEVVDLLLSDEGLAYGTLPKGLLQFHLYDQKSRTAAEEHLFEGLAYACKNDQVNLHFTVSSEHMQKFDSHISESVKEFSDTKFNIDYSVQQKETDTVASTLSFDPYRKDDGSLLFRPAGHGALLSNLNAIDSDVIFIKNIDNVVPDSLKDETIKYKKVLAGLLLNYQERAFELLERLEAGDNILEEGTKLLQEMGIKGFSENQVADLLDRPIRVCGMVKNEGEPGGGPFWVKKDNIESLQIVESAQVDVTDPQQKKTFEEGTHFNPVDLICATKNYRAEKFDLLKYRDDETGFITEKSAGGQKLLAMELPGLWNGSMANWNTIFVEVPLITFNPVKTVTDLLKSTHR
ncbi:MAG: DUF4301 family protein [Ekhidna sp.]|nr:DUF4301 family protein [Ekhidna sp.]